MLLKGQFKKFIKNDYHGTISPQMLPSPTDLVATDAPDAPDTDYTSPVLLGSSAAVGYMLGSERAHTKAVLLVDAQNALVDSQRVRIDELRLQLDNHKTIPKPKIMETVKENSRLVVQTLVVLGTTTMYLAGQEHLSNVFVPDEKVFLPESDELKPSDRKVQDTDPESDELKPSDRKVQDTDPESDELKPSGRKVHPDTDSSSDELKLSDGEEETHSLEGEEETHSLEGEGDSQSQLEVEVDSNNSPSWFTDSPMNQ